MSKILALIIIFISFGQNYFMKINKITIFLSFLLFAFTLSAQHDFNNFKNLKAEGDIPSDFTDNTFSKISEDLTNKNGNLKGNQEKVFLEGIHYAINDLLHSGMVVYGDEVSTYVTAVANKLLSKNEDLRNKLRFYTIKSNETNAFSTYQGIIFVTTGLISQLTNEAQLAYVLSHEIAHYTQEHVVQTFDLNTRNKKNVDKISTLSKFSKENEFEADKLGIKMYYDAGYSKEELISTFDVLLYSYLPFEEIEFPKTYLNSDLMTIPESFYPKTSYPIKAVEDSDDSKSSHPNIKKRKEAVQNELENYKEAWGKVIYHFGEERFKNIRTTCRFESIRTDIVDAQFDDALYSIFILEKDYPNSIYLKRMKAKAWLGVAQYKSEGDLSKKLPSSKDLEGEIAGLQYLMKELSKSQIITVSMRMVQDVKSSNANDSCINAIWERMVKTFAIYGKFDLEKFSQKTYDFAVQDYIKAKSDTVATIKFAEEKENLSKYDKIKKQNSTSGDVVLDTASFYLYALTDLIQDKNFKEKFQFFKDQKAQKEKEEDEYKNFSKKERKRYDKEKVEGNRDLSQSSFVYLEPMVFSLTKKGVDRIKSEKLQIDYTQAVKDVSSNFGMDSKVIGSENLMSEGTEMFNQRSLLMSYFNELMDNEDIDVLSTDYDEINRYFNNNQEKTSYLTLSILSHSKKMRFKLGTAIYATVFYPAIFFYYPIVFMKRDLIEFDVILINLKKNEVVKVISLQSNEPVNKHTIKARVYDLLKNLK